MLKRDELFDNELLGQLLEEVNIDLLLVSSRHNVRYLTGGYFFPLFVWDTNTRGTQYLPFIGVPQGRTDEAFFIGRPWETGVLEDAGVWISDCQETPTLGIEPAVELLSETVTTRGFASSCIGVEMTVLPAEAYLLLKRLLPHAQFVDCTPIMDNLRAVKHEREIDIIRRGTLKNLTTVNEVLTSVVPGMTTKSVADAVAKGYRERDIHFLYALVCAGPSFYRAASEHILLKENHILQIDTGALEEGYTVETCRTGHLGKSSEEAQAMLGLCRELEHHMLPWFTPGMMASAIQQEADRFLGERASPFRGNFIAHGIGMIHHEKPVISATSGEYLQEGMVLSLEMEHFSEGTGHVKIEDMVVVRGDGVEILSPGGKRWNHG